MSAVPIENEPNLTLVPALDEWLADLPDEGVESIEELIEQPDTVEEVAGIEEPVVTHHPPVTTERWKITSERGAVWAMRKLQTAIDEKATHAATAKAEQDRIRAWLDTVQKPLDSTIEHFTFLLNEFHRGIVDRDLELVDAPPTLAGPVDEAHWGKVKHKTLTVPNGKVEARRQPGRFDVVDEEAALEYLREHAPHLIKWTPAIKAAEVAEGGARWNDELDSYEFPIHTSDGEILDAVVAKYPDARVESEPEMPGNADEDGGTMAYTVWVAIPGVRLDGAGVVKFTPKPA